MCTTHKPFSAMCISVTIFDIKQKLLLGKISPDMPNHKSYPPTELHLLSRPVQAKAGRKERQTD